MAKYPLIADHGLIGDLQTAALVATDGSIDWFCSPRFDSPSIFGSLLDAEHGGHFGIRPTVETFAVKQLYFPDTAILITRFMADEGVGELVDFMPISGTAATERHRLVRMLRCVRGALTFAVDIAPRFNYGRDAHITDISENGVVFRSASASVTVHVVREPTDERLARVDVGNTADVSVLVPLRAGDTRGMVLETEFIGKPREIRPAEVQQLLESTVEFWRGWVSQTTYRGRWRETLLRSAITLKLMSYAPSGALVAAPTAGLPEEVGGERNWDYRYTWIRDASFSVYSLLALGFVDEAAALGVWIRNRVQESAGGGTGPLSIMYRVDGSALTSEESLPHWEGYRGSSPVRVGNGAADQLQLDIYGEAMDSLYAASERGLQVGHAGWLAICQMLDWLADNWDQPEEGIWETRGGRKEFTFGRLMCWVAFDRGIRLAHERGWPASVDRWTTERDAVYRQVFDRGWNPQLRAFVQQYGDRVLDSSLLRMSKVGFISARDPMWLSTLDAMDAELVTDSLVYRYDPSASPDGLQGSEGTFSLCSFAYVEALARAGRLDEARLIFEKMLTYANHVGLYAEEIALNGEQIGNFPQAFTHLALIDAALVLDTALDSSTGSVASAVITLPPPRTATPTAPERTADLGSPAS